jgi:tripartite-type tricarboxylate transporter receptor subunit TctC
MDLIAKAAPDGYTLGIATMSQLVFNSYLFAKLPYDPLRDFRSIGGLVSGPIAVAVNASVAAGSFRDLAGHARAHPGDFRYAVPQLGSPPHVVALLVLRTTEIEMSVVPFKSAMEALRSVLSGDVPVMFEAPPIIAEHVKSGRLRALAVTGRHRDRLLPDTPTLEEEGFAGIQGDVWIGLVAPAATPDHVASRLNMEVNEALRSSELKQYLEAAGWRITGGSAGAFALVITESHAIWGKIIRDAGLHLD